MRTDQKKWRSRQLAVIAVLAAALVAHGGAAAQTTARPNTQPLLDSARARVAAFITPSTMSGPPPEASAFMRELIGEYGSTHDPLVVLENGGILNALFGFVTLEPLMQIRGDTFRMASDSQRVVFTRDGTHHITGIRIPDATFARRAIAPDEGKTFHITPLQPVEKLRREALAASPPVERGEFLQSDLVELRSLDPTIHYDIRYATNNNFMGAVFYSSAHAYMQRPAAEALVRAAARLKQSGYGVVIHDAYRPWYVTKMFWDATPDPLKDFVADPASGSRHNRGAAVDMSLYDLNTGKTVAAVSGYDEFSPRAYPDYAGGTTRQRWYRALLRTAMEAEGFTVYRAEWWHFDYKDWKKYPIGNVRFEDIR